MQLFPRQRDSNLSPICLWKYWVRKMYEKIEKSVCEIFSILLSCRFFRVRMKQINIALACFFAITSPRWICRYVFICVLVQTMSIVSTWLLAVEHRGWFRFGLLFKVLLVFRFKLTFSLLLPPFEVWFESGEIIFATPSGWFRGIYWWNRLCLFPDLYLRRGVFRASVTC